MKDQNNISIKQAVSRSTSPEVAARELFEGLNQPDISLALFYCSPNYNLDALGNALSGTFGDIRLIGCTTAGEISPDGYMNGSLTGVSIASPELSAVTARIDHLERYQFGQGAEVTRSLLSRLAQEGKNPAGGNTFGYLLIDGLSMQEESVVSSLHRSLGTIQLFGGSAGDGIRFKETFIYHEGAFHRNAALFTLIHTSLPFRVFKTAHFTASDKKMVVTEADPTRRIVTEINGEPAGREYARMVGLEVNELTPFIFASHPVVVRVGGEYFVRSIQKVNPDESLTFFCAIDEGIVLTVARGVDLIDNLKTAFAEIRKQIGPPQLVLGCDCILRNLELDRRNVKDEAGKLLAANNVVGFSTYGEQINAMHVNQTFTGVAIGAA